jgi:hypothetical protein
MTSFSSKLLALSVLALLPPLAHADCRSQSPAHAVALVELYTSEGCDSCPPADGWLSKLDARGDAVVPIGLHVDYWDRLGWKDRFASVAFTERQYEQMRRQHTAFVYTPQILLQGRDFSQWRTGSYAAAIAAITAQPARAMIGLAVQAENGNARVDVRAKVPEQRDRPHARLTVALVQDRLVSEVKAGENAGRRLTHDHVVRQWRSGLPIRADGEAQERVTFPLPHEAGPLTVVAFVEDTVSGEVLQAFALALCEPR